MYDIGFCCYQQGTSAQGILAQMPLSAIDKLINKHCFVTQPFLIINSYMKKINKILNVL